MKNLIRANAPYLAVAAAVAVPLVRIGLDQYIEYDGWIHIFVSRAQSLEVFFTDWHKTTHPPLFFLLLKVLSFLGTSRLAYRIVPIAGGLVAVFMVGKITARITSSRTFGALAAAAFGFSTSTVFMACDVRSYTLAIAFVLIAFDYLLRMLLFEERARDRFLFAASVIAGISALYATAFFFTAAALVPFVIAVFRPDYRRRLISHIRATKGILPMTFAAPAMVLAVAYRYHMWLWAHPLIYMPHLYFDRDRSTLAAFLLNGMRLEFNLFSRFPIASERLAVPLLIALVIASLFALMLTMRAREVVAAAPVVVLLLLVAEIVAASALGKYPLGGHLRHQFLIFPFIILSLFSIAGIALRAVPGGMRHAIVSLIVVLVAANSLVGSLSLAIVRPALYVSEMHRFRAVVPESTLLYLDEFSTFAFFSHHDTWNWHLSGTDGDWLRYELTKDGKSMRMIRVRSQWNLKPFDEALYNNLRRAMARSGEQRIGLFALHVMPAGLTTEDVRSRITKAAAKESLDIEHIVVDGEHLYVTLATAPSYAAPR